MRKTFVLILVFAGVGLGQLRVPVTGYTLDSAASEVRPIVGTFGAALIGGAIALPPGASALALSPNQQFAILKGDHLAVALLGPEGFSDPVFVAGAISNPDRIAFSAGGSVAALYSEEAGIIQSVAGLPDAPHVIAESAFYGLLAALAINNDASAILAAKADSGVILLSTGGPSRLLMSDNSIGALQFLTNTQALAVDAQSNQLLLLSGLPGDPSLQVIADATAGIDHPGDLQITGDRRRALLTNLGGGNLLSVALDTGDVVSVACAFRPVAVRPLLRSGAYLISDDQGRNVWMFDAGASRVAYVPARDK